MSKYKSTPCTVGAESYRSKRERDRHQELLLLVKAGKIANLRREVSFWLAPPVRIVGEKRQRPALRYFADFVYDDLTACAVVVEDAKGVHTPVYRIKKHLMATINGIHVRES